MFGDIIVAVRKVPTVCKVFIKFLTRLQCVTAYTADKKMVLAQLKIRKPMRAFSVKDHHLCVFSR